jgi:hypothetical protein
LYSPLALALRSRSTGKESTLLETVAVGGWQIMPEDCCRAGTTGTTVGVVVDRLAATLLATPLLLVTVVVIGVAAEAVSVATTAVVAVDVDDGRACW